MLAALRSNASQLFSQKKVDSIKLTQRCKLKNLNRIIFYFYLFIYYFFN